jgi:thiol-disulfide isomerase/thioredoxin
MGVLLERPIVRMPGLAEGAWLNTAGVLTREGLRGRVVLVDFWDYTCINCLRTLPYLIEWHKRYRDLGLTIIGVHAPEFRFARARSHLEVAIEELGIPYPVLLDNEYQTWERFTNKAWPTKHLIDSEGYIRFKRQGEGYYQETEQAIQVLLRQRDPEVSLPPLLPPLREEDTAGAVCYRPTPELYAGYQGGGLFSGGLGNPEGYVADSLMMYTLPEERAAGQFYLEGFWRSGAEWMAFAGQQGGRVVLPYQAVGVNGVLAPSSDPVEMLLKMRPTEAEPLIEVRQDGRPLTAANAGADVILDEGRSVVRVERPRLYELVRNGDYGAHELEMVFGANGLALFSFTFTTCVAGVGAAETFRVG